MTDLNYPSNSHKNREKKKYEDELQQYRKKPVAHASGKRKTNELRETLELFGFDFEGTLNDIVVGQIIPDLTENIKIAILEGFAALLNVDTTFRHSGSRYSGRSSYNNYYIVNDKSRRNSREAPPEERGEYRKPRTSFGCNDLEFDTRAAAETVLKAMYEELDEYRWVSVADFYDFADESIESSTAFNYGWYSLEGSYVNRLAKFGGYSYVIILPKPVRRKDD